MGGCHEKFDLFFLSNLRLEGRFSIEKYSIAKCHDIAYDVRTLYIIVLSLYLLLYKNPLCNLLAGFLKIFLQFLGNFFPTLNEKNRSVMCLEFVLALRLGFKVFAATF
jgi:hypothetical protein